MGGVVQNVRDPLTVKADDNRDGAVNVRGCQGEWVQVMYGLFKNIRAIDERDTSDHALERGMGGALVGTDLVGSDPEQRSAGHSRTALHSLY
ncbi:hypothetical protein MTO96_036847 [Rhipicephalus appendiculatus]